MIYKKEKTFWANFKKFFCVFCIILLTANFLEVITDNASAKDARPLPIPLPKETVRDLIVIEAETIGSVITVQDPLASGGYAVVDNGKNAFPNIFSFSLTIQAGGYYRYYLRAKSETNSTMTVEVVANTTYEKDLYALRNDYRWFITQQFYVAYKDSINLSVHAPTQTEYIDKMMLVRFYDNNFQSTGKQMGQITDDVVLDSDGDGRPDMSEMNSNVWWFEAEHHISKQVNAFGEEIVKEVNELDASNGKAITINKTTGSLVDMLDEFSFPDFPVGSEYKFYVRAKGSGASSTIYLNVSNNFKTTYFIQGDTHLMSPPYRWYSTPVFSTSGMVPKLELQVAAMPLGEAFVYIDKIMLICTPKVSVIPGHVSDPLDPDTDGDHRYDGVEIKDDLFCFEGEDCVTNLNQIDSTDQYASNSKSTKKGWSNYKLIDTTILPPYTSTRGIYNLFLRAKTNSLTNDSIQICLNKNYLNPLDHFELTYNNYRWYISSDIPSGVTAIDVLGDSDVRLDKIMLVHKPLFVPGQITDVMDPDMDWDNILDGSEINEHAFYLEAEAHVYNRGQLILGIGSSNRPDASNSTAISPTYILGQYELIDSRTFPILPVGEYQLYFRAKAVVDDEEIYVDVDGELGFSQTYRLTDEYYWYVTDSFFYIPGFTNVNLTTNNANPILDKLMFAHLIDVAKNSNEDSLGKRYSDPIDPNIDWDGLKDGVEINTNIFWFEAENYVSQSATIVSDHSTQKTMASNFKAVQKNSDGEMHSIVLNLTGGSYRYYVRARLEVANSQSMLVIKAKSDTVNMEKKISLLSEYRWYPALDFTIKTDKYSPLKRVILSSEYLYCGSPSSYIYVDKFMVVNVEGNYDKDDNIILGMLHGPSRWGAFLLTPGKISDPYDRDSDYDTLKDGKEINGFYVNTDYYRTDPLNRDGDIDHLWDSLEVGMYNDPDTSSTTNPNRADTDMDGLPDGWIDGWGYNTVTYDYEIGPTRNDQKNIGQVGNFFYLEFEDENLNGLTEGGGWDSGGGPGSGPGETDPTKQDTDDDFAGDHEGVEIMKIRTDPLDDDTDDDGLMDWEGFAYGTDPLDDDTDNDNLTDGLELGRGTPEGSDTLATWQCDNDPTTKTNPLDIDSDNDGLPDGWIDDWGFDVNTMTWDYNKNPSNTLNSWDIGEGEDKDLDGKFDNNWNVDKETNPKKKDSDNGGVSDNMEILYNPPYDIEKPYYPINAVNINPNPANNATDDGFFKDNDKDGIINGIEDYVGLDKNDSDTDDDGIKDGEEFFDKDHDSMLDALEFDCDNDGLGDGLEQGIATGLPGGSFQGGRYTGTAPGFVGDGDAGATTTKPYDDDTDDDGLLDGTEDNTNGNHNGKVDAGESDPNDFDTDGDKLGDGLEKGLALPQGTDTNSKIFTPDIDPATTTNPIVTDSDSDGLWDGYKDGNGNKKYDRSLEVGEDLNLNGRKEISETDSTTSDTDGDGLSDGKEWPHGSNDFWTYEFESEATLYKAKKVKDVNAINMNEVTTYTAIESEDSDVDSWTRDVTKKMFKIEDQLPNNGDNPELEYAEYDIYFRVCGRENLVVPGVHHFFLQVYTVQSDGSFGQAFSDCTDYLFYSYGLPLFNIYENGNYFWHSFKHVRVYPPTGSSATKSAIQIYGFTKHSGLRLDRMIIVKTDTDNSQYKYLTQGQITDPLVPDIDNDGRKDSDEINDNVWWYEAEDSFVWDYDTDPDQGNEFPLHTNGQRKVFTPSDYSASNNRVLSFFTVYYDYDQTMYKLLEGPVPDKYKTFESGTYRCYVKYSRFWVAGGHQVPGPGRLHLQIYDDNTNILLCNYPVITKTETDYFVHYQQFTLSARTDIRIEIYVTADIVLDYILFVKEKSDITKELKAISNPICSDSDSDGMSDGWEALYDLHSIDPSGAHGPEGNPDNDDFENLKEFNLDSNPLKPTLWVEYNNNLKTKDYYCWKKHNDKYFAVSNGKSAGVVIRRGSTFSVQGASGQISVNGPGTLDLNGNEITIDKRTVSNNGDPVGIYTITYSTLSFKLYVIFELPDSSSANDSNYGDTNYIDTTELTPAGIDSYLYNENNKKDDISVMWFTIDGADWQDNSGKWHSTYGAGLFWNRQYSKRVFVDEVIQAINGETNQWDAAEALADHLFDYMKDKSGDGDIDPPNPYFDMFEWLDGKSIYGSDASECSAYAGAHTSVLRSAGIPARPVVVDRHKSGGGGFDHSSEIWVDDPDVSGFDCDWFVIRAYKTKVVKDRSEWYQGEFDNQLMVTAAPTFDLKHLDIGIDPDNDGNMNWIEPPPFGGDSAGWYDYNHGYNNVDDQGSVGKHEWVMFENDIYWVGGDGNPQNVSNWYSSKDD